MTDPKQAAPEGGSAKYIIGCKLPNGLICELGKFGDENYRAVTLNGSNSARVTAVGNFGLTEVAKDFWDAWVKKNNRLDFMKRGMVFAVADMASAESAAKELAAVKTGLEPLDPLKKITDPRTGETVLEGDMTHFKQGQRDVVQAREAARR